MKLLIKKVLKTSISSVGLEVKRNGKGLLGKLSPPDRHIPKIGGYALKFVPSEEDKFKWVQSLDIRTIIDVGACTGGFASEISEILPQAKIYSFEPLIDCFKQLNKELSNRSNFRSFNFALGDTKGKERMYHNEFSPCSSLLEASDTLIEQLPFTQNMKEEIIVIDTLDNVAESLELERNILVKMDVQGFEDKVIAGGVKVLKRTKIVIIETSFREIYKSQPLFSDIYQTLVGELGFSYAGSWSQQKSPIDGSPFQEDSIFIK
jgi:FkbM family methyltransferase